MVSSLKNKTIIEQLFAYKKQKSKNFDHAIKDSITAKQLKEETTTYIKSLNWKK